MLVSINMDKAGLPTCRGRLSAGNRVHTYEFNSRTSVLLLSSIFFNDFPDSTGVGPPRRASPPSKASRRALSNLLETSTYHTSILFSNVR